MKKSINVLTSNHIKYFKKELEKTKLKIVYAAEDLIEDLKELKKL